MMPSTKKLAVAVAAFSALSLTAACGAGDGNAEAASDNMSGQTSSSSGSKSASPTGLVGPGCDDYAKAVPDGAGSVQGMGQDRVAEAASNNPLLTTLTAAVSGGLNPRVDLVETLDGDQFTVFAPVDDAFGRLPKKTVDSLAKPKNAELLKAVLTYHVVPGRIAPDDIAGQQTTVEGATVEVSGSGNNLKVNDAKVICGGVQTANATVYLIDSVLMPPM